MKNLRSIGVACTVFAFCLAGATFSYAQSFTDLASFDLNTGYFPRSALVGSTDGNLYGTASVSGPNSYGTVFKTTTAGAVTVLHGFDLTDGAAPLAALTQGRDGNFYGTTYEGANGYGTVFKVTPAGEFTTLHVFCSESNCSDGENPWGGLVEGTNGNFYGTASGGGAYYSGTVFEITPAGTLTTLYNFCPQLGCADGEIPEAGLVQASNGAFYGTTFRGGAYDEGTVFRITAAGKLKVLHSFQLTDGAYPTTGLIQATNGNFYGTTQRYAANNAGTFFEITPTGKLTTLYNFCSQSNCADGGSPWGLVQGTDGNFYGATLSGGATGYGTLFKITAEGKLTTLYSFCPQSGCADGDTPYAGLLQATDGNFYGTSAFGGAINGGTLFRLSTGLGPFVETLPTSGKVGTTVIILGTNLTGTTKVSFDGTAATFTIASSSEIETTVPAGAKTGAVRVTTPSGTLDSNLIFKVTPQIKRFNPLSGAIGTQVVITGVSLRQTTKVTIGGKAASFTVNSDTQVTATVPTGAKTGKIVITTPGGTATSATSFTVT